MKLLQKLQAVFQTLLVSGGSIAHDCGTNSDNVDKLFQSIRDSFSDLSSTDSVGTQLQGVTIEPATAFKMNAVTVSRSSSAVSLTDYLELARKQS